MADTRQEVILRRIDPTTIGLPAGPVTDLEIARGALGLAAAAGYNLLAATTQLTHLPVGHVLTLSVVAFDSAFSAEQTKARSNGTWYLTDGGKRALHRSALNQLASAAGLSAVPEHCRVTRVGPFHWTARHAYRGKGLDGVERVETGSVEIDLTDGSAEATKAAAGPNGASALANARRWGARNAESKAANRAIRAFLSLRGSYTQEEAERPFLLPRVMWVPDMGDPVVRRLVAAKELGVIDQLFGAEARAAIGQAEPELRVVEAQEPARLEERTPAKPAPNGKPSAHPDDDRELPLQPPVEAERPKCRVCGITLSKRRASVSLDTHGVALCDDHEPPGGAR